MTDLFTFPSGTGNWSKTLFYTCELCRASKETSVFASEKDVRVHLKKVHNWEEHQ